MFSYYGETKTVDLIENGGNVTVTQSNKHEFVQLYVQWLLERSIEQQFKAFQTGFKQVCEGSFFSLFRVEEVDIYPAHQNW